MDNPILTIVLIAIVLCVILYQYFYSRSAIVKRKLKRSLKTPVNLCKNNELVKIVGQVEIIGEALFAPLSGRKCAYFHVIVEEKRRHGKSSSYYKIIDKEIKTTFLLRDGENVVLVSNHNLLTHLVKDAKYSSGFLDDATKNLETFLNENGYESTGLLGFNKSMRYEEGILEVGERVAVVGKARWSDGPKEGLSSDYKKLLVIEPYEKEPVYLSDDPRTLN